MKQYFLTATNWIDIMSVTGIHLHRPAEGRTSIDYLRTPDQYFRSFWNLSSNPSGKYKNFNESTRKNKILIKYFKVTWLPIRMKDFFRF